MSVQFLGGICYSKSARRLANHKWWIVGVFREQQCGRFDARLEQIVDRHSRIGPGLCGLGGKAAQEADRSDREDKYVFIAEFGSTSQTREVTTRRRRLNCSQLA